MDNFRCITYSCVLDFRENEYGKIQGNESYGEDKVISLKEIYDRLIFLEPDFVVYYNEFVIEQVNKNLLDMPVALLNTSILTESGEYKLEDISLNNAKYLIKNRNLDSAIGHESTAEIMTTLLETKVEVNRQMFSQRVGQKALVFKLNIRTEEGKILTLNDIKKIGYKFQVLTRLN